MGCNREGWGLLASPVLYIKKNIFDDCDCDDYIICDPFYVKPR